MIEKWSYKLSTTKAFYTPKDISNLERCIQEAVEISQFEKKPCELHIGKDVYVIDAAQSTQSLVKSYMTTINYSRTLSSYIAKMKEATK